MARLDLNFAGLKLNNPVIVAACPATETVDRIRRCAEAGAGAVITKSIGTHPAKPNAYGRRRMFVDSRGLWGTSTFERETLSLECGCSLVAEAREVVDIPIIASVTACDCREPSWLPMCLALVDSGAAAIQLDLFYLPAPLLVNNSRQLHNLVASLSEDIGIPVIPKLNIEIPATVVSEVFAGTRIAGISLLDSVRVPPPVCWEPTASLGFQFLESPSSASLFGGWQLPLTLHYVSVLTRETTWPLIAGGGIETPADAISVLAAGAQAVQVAASVLVRGYHHIETIVQELDRFLGAHHFSTIEEMRSSFVKLTAGQEVPVFSPAVAAVHVDHCKRCGRCRDLCFCEAIMEHDGLPQIVPEACDGCSACTYFCPNAALYLHSSGTAATRTSASALNPQTG